MTERDTVHRVVELAVRELSPSVEDKARHRVPLGLGPAALGRAASGLATGAAGTTRRAQSAVSGWRALRASGGAGRTAGALLLGAGVALGFWLRGALRDAEPTETSAVAVASVRSAADQAAPKPQTAPSSEIVPVAPTAPSSPSADSSARGDRAERAASPEQVEAATAGGRDVPPRARARAKLERRATGPNAAGDESSFVAQPFDEELALLQRVEHAMRANEYSLALALLTELDDRFATTRLEEERRAARLIAECRLGLPGSHQRGEQFLEQRPNSVYAHRLQMACTPR
jgi:hypothetical protein